MLTKYYMYISLSSINPFLPKPRRMMRSDGGIGCIKMRGKSILFAQNEWAEGESVSVYWLLRAK